MTKTPMKKYQLWSPNSFAVFKEVERRNVEVKIYGSFRVQGRLQDMALKGRFFDVTGSTVIFAVLEQKILPGKGKEEERSCNFSFRLEQAMPSGDSEKIGFYGRGSILEAEKNADGTPRRLMLRLSRQYVTRKLRRDKRVLWDAANTGLLGLMVVTALPGSLTELRARLKAYFKNATAPQLADLVNISAGGACLCVEEELAKKALMADELYMFFLLPKSAAPGDPPYILMGKKAGLCREACAVGAALRMRFLYELEWGKSHTTLHWADIGNSGSPRLRVELDARVRADAFQSVH